MIIAVRGFIRMNERDTDRASVDRPKIKADDGFNLPEGTARPAVRDIMTSISLSK